MTDDDFRKEEGLRLELATFLRSPTGMIALSILRDKASPIDVPSTADALASCRVLSQFHGYRAAIDDLERLAVPLRDPNAPMPDPQWGADPNLGDHLPLQVDLAKMKELQDARDHARAASVAARAASGAADNNT
jgi:hypothetical protein